MRGGHKGLYIVGLLMLWGGCGNGTATPEPSAAEAPVRMLSKGDIATVVRGDITVGPAISGILTPAVMIDIKAKMPGDMESVLVQEGQTVRKGQSLATMDVNELGYQLRSAEAELKAAEVALKNAGNHVERTRRLVGEGAMAPRDLDLATAEAEAAQAQASLRQARVHELRKIIADARFPSPIDGIISRRLVEPGDHVDDGDALLTVVDPRVIELTATVSSEDVGRVRPDLPVVFRVEGYQDRTFEGRVDRINPGADPVTRQVSIYVRIPNDRRELIGGLFAAGRIVTDRQETGLLIPNDALRSGADGGVSVYRIRQSVATAVPVSVGLRDESTGMVAVTGELQEGDTILAGPATDIPSGARVTMAVADSTERR